MDEWKKDRIAACIQGENPMVLARMHSGFAVLGDNQFLPGYCVLLRCPKVGSLQELSHAERASYLLDTTLLGDVIQRALSPLRLNYLTLANLDHYLHTHVEPRYEWEAEPYRSGPGFLYPKDVRFTAQYEYSEARYGDVKRTVAESLLAVMREVDGYAQA
jgi:diadenosine tetraphosphate (Ap4A) HIT family hydrolase